MGLFSNDEKNKIAARHFADQATSIVPQSLRELQARKDDDGQPLYTRSQREEYLRRADRLEKQSGQR